MSKSTDTRRIRILSNTVPLSPRVPVVYWMSRDQRARDNWALTYAQEQALHRKTALAVVFDLDAESDGLSRRQRVFMLAGLDEVRKELEALSIPLVIVSGTGRDGLSLWLEAVMPSLLVTDYSPLRPFHERLDRVVSSAPCAVHQVDAHNIVPVWTASPKLEYAAFTIRPKIKRLLPEFLTEIDPLRKHPYAWPDTEQAARWQRQAESYPEDAKTASRRIVEPGQAAALELLDRFRVHRLTRYEGQRNDPNADIQSGLSPYLHFGQISAQRVAWEANKEDPAITGGFLEELIVRRELADNFCHYQPDYDSISAFPDWAQRTLIDHRLDPRPYLYTADALESADTHDPLWNAAQMEMTATGRIPGYLRMYWAKKILEWSPDPEAALARTIYLNDTYSLDGHDPNGYAGIAWSVGGVHDRVWPERPIFGKIRYMSLGGCRRKFDVESYIEKVETLTREAAA